MIGRALATGRFNFHDWTGEYMIGKHVYTRLTKELRGLFRATVERREGQVDIAGRM